ncbi:unnamed protein product [Lota lota]
MRRAHSLAASTRDGCRGGQVVEEVVEEEVVEEEVVEEVVVEEEVVEEEVGEKEEAEVVEEVVEEEVVEEVVEKEVVVVVEEEVEVVEEEVVEDVKEEVGEKEEAEVVEEVVEEEPRSSHQLEQNHCVGRVSEQPSLVRNEIAQRQAPPLHPSLVPDAPTSSPASSSGREYEAGLRRAKQLVAPGGPRASVTQQTSKQPPGITANFVNLHPNNSSTTLSPPPKPHVRNFTTRRLRRRSAPCRPRMTPHRNTFTEILTATEQKVDASRGGNAPDERTALVSVGLPFTITHTVIQLLMKEHRD